MDDQAAVDLLMRAFRGGEKIYAPDQEQALARWREAEAQADSEYEATMRARMDAADFDGWEADQAYQSRAADIAVLVERAGGDRRGYRRDHVRCT